MYEKKLRSFIMLLTITLSTMVLFIGLSLNEIINNTYETMNKGIYGNGNILVTKANEDDPFFNIQDFETDSMDIEERLDLIQSVGTSELHEKDVKVTLIGLDTKKASTMNLIHPIDSPKDVPLQEKEVMISSRTASDYDLAIDDEITVDINNEPHTFSIGAISEDHGLYFSEKEGILLVTSPRQIHDMYETEHVASQILIQVDNEKVDHITEALADKNTNFSVQQTSQLDTIKRDEETFQTAVILAIAIIVMISAYVIFSLSKIIVSERLPVLGTFRSVGASKRMVNRMLRMEFLLYGTIGAVVGMLLASLLLPIVADSFNEYKAFGAKTVVTYNPVYLIIAFVFGAVFPMFGGLFHIYRASKQPLKEIILHTPHTKKERAIRSLYIGLFLFMSSLGLYFYNQHDNLLLAVGAVLLLFIAIVLFMPTFSNGISTITNKALSHMHQGELTLGIKNIANNKTVSNNVSMIIVVFLLLLMIGTTSAGIDQYINNTVEKDFDVTVDDLEEDFSTYEDIATVEGVSDSYMQHVSVANYAMHGENDTFIVYGVEDIHRFDQFYSGATFLQDAKTNLNHVENGIILDAYQAKRYSLDVGDKVSLEPLDQDNQPVHENEIVVEIAGIMEAASLTTNRDIIIMNLNDYNDYFVDVYNQILVTANDPSEAKTVKENIERHYSDAEMTVQTFEEMLGSQKATVDTLIHGVLFIILLGLIIGLLGITNNLLVSFAERKKEYAVLYSVCMSRLQLIKMLIYEMLMTFISVMIIGFVVGFGTTFVWSRLLHAVGLKIQFSFNYELFFILSGAVLVLLTLATWTIVRKVSRLDVLHELRYE